MNKLIQFLVLPTLLALALTCGPVAKAADSKIKPADKPANGSSSAEVSKPKREAYPFYGYVAAVDPQARTVSLKKKEGMRVLRLDDKSKIEVGGKTAALASVKVGDYAHGQLHKDKRGSEVIVSAKFDKEGPRRDKPAAASATGDKPSAKANK